MKLKSTLLFIFLFSTTAFSQTLPINWYNLDQQTDSVAGTSANKAYEWLQGKPSTNVIVAIIDDGGDIDHQDLKNHVWINLKEIAGNNLDDDNNGYIDDINGWNFLGNKTDDVSYDNLEITRIYRKWNPLFKDSTSSVIYPNEFNDYQYAKQKFEKELTQINKTDARLRRIILWLDEMQKKTGKDTLAVDEIQNYQLTDTSFQTNKERIVAAMKSGTSYKNVVKEVVDSYKRNKEKLDYHYNLAFDPRQLIGDDYDNVNDRNYGNPRVKSPEGSHGTHVGGIVGAIRGNEIGTDGVANNVALMFLRVIPNGDERDKDVANAIRYAAANGAKIINMSFGKPLPYNKTAVDDAVKFAISKDVLIVHAAGNEALNLDVDKRFPNPIYKDNTGTAWNNWLDVGAVGADGKPGVFSNYGKNYVDLFAPGVKIKSTLPNNEYGNRNGTSMAAPVASGVAAMIRSYYPELTAAEVKSILIKTVTTPKEKVLKPGTKDELVYWNDLCKTGGLINAYNALKMAEKKASRKRK